MPLTDARNGDAPYGPYVGGLDLASDPGRDGAFHVVWVDLGAGVTDGSGLAPLWHARSTDGGRSWQPPTLVTRFRPPPHRFARDAFRNVVLPSLAVGRRGAVHVAFAAQETTGGAGHADVRVVGSQDGGTSWTAPVTVNQDGGASDQFQPSLSAARDVLDVAFLDRRLDGVSIDQYLARSADGGRTWVETRLSHDSWDPAINPPRSPTGEVIGDQQAIVSDGCETVVVGVDTHMANAESRDAPMDGRRPRSRHQQAHAWRLPADAPWNEPSCGNG